MPKRIIKELELECDFCGEKTVFNLDEPSSKVVPRLSRWRGIVNAGAPAGEGVPDQTKWYDSSACLISGIKKDDEAKRLEAQVSKAAEGDKRLSPVAQASGAILKELP